MLFYSFFGFNKRKEKEVSCPLAGCHKYLKQRSAKATTAAPNPLSPPIAKYRVIGIIIKRKGRFLLRRKVSLVLSSSEPTGTPSALLELDSWELSHVKRLEHSHGISVNFDLLGVDGGDVRHVVQPSFSLFLLKLK